MTDHTLRRDEAAEILAAINKSYDVAEDQHKLMISSLCALTQAVLEVGEQLRLANRLAIAAAPKNIIISDRKIAATLGIRPQE